MLNLVLGFITALFANVYCSELTDISLLASYVYLRYVDLSGNNLRDVSALNSLSHLLCIQLSDNKLTRVDVPTNLTYLQTANFESNRIQSLAGISHPALESLNLNCKIELIHCIHILCVCDRHETAWPIQS